MQTHWLDLAEQMASLEKFEIKNKEWARNQIKKMVKYNNMSTKRLAKKIGIKQRMVSYFKKHIKKYGAPNLGRWIGDE